MNQTKLTNEKRIINYLQENKKYGFQTKDLVTTLDVPEGTVWNTVWKNSNLIEKVKVSSRETYYMAKLVK